MAKAAFFYANGSSYLLNMLEVGFGIEPIGLIRTGDKVANPTTSLGSVAVKGLNDRTYVWDGNPANDPFPQMLNTEAWDVTRISYPDDGGAVGASITYGIDQVVKMINNLAGGTKFALGGYSLGAAVMSGVYDKIKSSGGELYGRRADFLGGVAFGNPRRQLNYRGDTTVTGTWSGTWDATHASGFRWYRDAAPNNTGGRGAFPATGTWARLAGCESANWQEFVAPGDIFASSGDSTNGTNWTAALNILLGLQKYQYFGTFNSQTTATPVGITSVMLTALNAALDRAEIDNLFIDGLSVPASIAGLGHTIYALLPPPGTNGVIPVTAETQGGKTYLKPNGLTAYQTALAWLEAKVSGTATSPLLLPPDRSTGWTTKAVTPVQVNMATVTSSSTIIEGNVGRIVIVERPSNVRVRALLGSDLDAEANRSARMRFAALIRGTVVITVDDPAAIRLRGVIRSTTAVTANRTAAMTGRRSNGTTF